MATWLGLVTCGHRQDRVRFDRRAPLCRGRHDRTCSRERGEIGGRDTFGHKGRRIEKSSV
ncbi:unnamed protein product [Ectocarpus sp. 12 AP-2014]